MGPREDFYEYYYTPDAFATLVNVLFSENCCPD